MKKAPPRPYPHPASVSPNPVYRRKSSFMDSMEQAKFGGPFGGRFQKFRGAILLISFVLVLWLNFAFIKPLVMGSIFAIVLYPLMTKTGGIRIPEILRATLVTILFAVSFLLPIGFIIFLGADAALDKIQSLAQGSEIEGRLATGDVIDAFGLGAWVDYLALITPVTEEQIRVFVSRSVTSGGAILAKLLQNFVANLPALIFSTFIILLTIFFLLIDGPRAVGFLRENSFFNRKQTNTIMSIVESLCYSVLVASIASGFVQSILIGIACVVTGTSGVFLIMLISLILSFVPVVGVAPVLIFLILQSFVTGQYTDGFVFIGFSAVVSISDNIVRPYVLKGGAKLHPLVGFVAAFGGLESIGFYGLFIGPVVAGLFFTLLPMVARGYMRTDEVITNSPVQRAK